MITNPRTIRFSPSQVKALEHLAATAERKKFFAGLIANAYNNNFPCDFRSCTSYLAGESDDRLYKGIMLMIEMSSRGIEAHEYFGEDFVRKLINDWELKPL